MAESIAAHGLVWSESRVSPVPGNDPVQTPTACCLDARYAAGADGVPGLHLQELHREKLRALAWRFR